MMALGQTWIHRVEDYHVIVVGIDDATITAIVCHGGNDWTRARFDRATFTEIFRWQPTCTRQR